MSLNRKDCVEKEHPSYGSVAISYIQGGHGRLFGSPLENNPTRISLRISHCKLMYDLSREWYFPTDEIVEVELSPAQFVDMITNPNRGSGIPCTIKYLGRKPVEPIPVEKVEAEKVRDDFDELTGKLANGLNGRMQEIKDILEKKTVGKKDRDEIKKILGLIEQDIRADLPYVLRSFEESTDKVTSHAKSEIATMYQMLVEKTGMKALQEMAKDHLLEDKKDE